MNHALRVAFALASVTGCVTHERLASEVHDAAGAARMPKVLACYEEAFENAGFLGEFDATVEFDALGGNGLIRNVSVTRVTATKGEPPPSFAPCLTRALEASQLTPGGAPPSGDLHVRGLTYAFRDASAATRAGASAETEHVLIGPRGDRCTGVYSHAPPRPVAVLFQELDDAQNQAGRSGSSEPDGKARALQRAYDVALELRKRIELDGWQPNLAAESRRRLAEHLAQIEKTATALGAAIGCTPKAE